ncbi:MAG: TorF family putative porin [Motiliproteus sp.]
MATTAAIAFQAQADTSITATLVSDYVYNGVSSTDGRPTLQASADWWSDAGVYAGVWGSGVNFNDGSNTRVELDYYVGYAGSINDSLGYDVGYAFYTYPGAADAGAEFDYGELYGSVTYNEATTAKLYLSEEYFGNAGKSVLLELSHSLDLGNDFSLTLAASQTSLLDEEGDAYFGPDAGDDSYNHWGASIAKSVGGVDLNLGACRAWPIVARAF